MNIAKDGWFTELGSMWPGQGLSLKVKEVLYKGKSKFQVTHSNSVLQHRAS
jgi:spermidine synthase